MCTPEAVAEEEESKIRPWYSHDDWLDTESRLKAGHEIDKERQHMWQEKLIKLREKSIGEKENMTDTREDAAVRSSAFEKSMLRRWSLERNESEATNAAEAKQRDDARARVFAKYQARIANVTTGWDEVQRWTDEAKVKEAKRSRYFHDLIHNRIVPGYSPNTHCDEEPPCGEREVNGHPHPRAIHPLCSVAFSYFPGSFAIMNL